MKEYIITTEKGANQQLHELIRCKDCVHWVKDKSTKNVGRCFGREHQWMIHSDGYCSEAERKEK